MVSGRLVCIWSSALVFSIFASATFFEWSSKRKALIASVGHSSTSYLAEEDVHIDETTSGEVDAAVESPLTLTPSILTAASSGPAFTSLNVPNSTSAYGLIRIPKVFAINKTRKTALELHDELYADIIEKEHQSVNLVNAAFHNNASAEVRERDLAKLKQAYHSFRWPNLCNTTSGVTSLSIAENGTIAVLLRTASESEMLELKTILLPSLVKHLRFKTSITLMHEGDKAPLEKLIKPFENSSWLSFRLVDITYLFNATPADYESVWRAKQKRPSILRHSKLLQRKQMAWSTMQCGEQPMGYRKMCAFWVVHVHTLPAFKGIRYIWRLDTDSQLLADVETSLYAVMHRCDAVFGYAHHMRDHLGCCMGLKESTFKFYEAHPEYNNTKIMKDRLKGMERYDFDGCPAWNTHFQLMDLDYFRGNEAYNAFVETIKQEIIGFRWGDHIVQSFFLRANEPPERTLCMQPWVPGYAHQEVGMSPHCHPHTALESMDERVLRARLRSETLRWTRAEWHFKDKFKESFAAGDSSKNNSIIVLVNTGSKEEMHNLSTILLPSLEKFLSFSVPVTFAYIGAEHPLQKLTSPYSKSPRLSFVYLNVSDTIHLSADDGIDKPLNPDVKRSCDRPSVLEKKLYVFWAAQLYSLPELSDFRMLWRLTPNSELTSPVKTNVFSVMSRANAAFGYLRHVRDSVGCSSCKGLGTKVTDLFTAFPKILPLDAKEQLRTREFAERYPKWRCPAWSSDFQIISTKYLRKSAIFKKYIHQVGKHMGAFGWPDSAVLSLFYRIDHGQMEAPGLDYTPPRRILCIQPWVSGYKYRGEHATANCAHNWPESFGR